MLFEITEQTHPVILDLRYATSNNVTGRSIYLSARCFLHEDARKPFEKAIDLAARQGLKFKIFDAFRPQYAQERLWGICPDPTYVMPPHLGSLHTRGIAIDCTLTEGGLDLDMGTEFDSFETKAHHGEFVSQKAEANRYLLLGVMVSAGWQINKNEWWHYQLSNSASYPLITENII